MSWWGELRRAAEAFLEQHGLAAAFLFLLVEEAGVPLPVPGDVLMLVLGVQAREGRVPLWQAIAVLELGTALGATLLYLLARWAGRDLVYRYGRYLRLTPPRLERAERWIRGYGALAVVVGRLVPGLRIATAVACGVFGLPVRQFLPAMAVGSLLYISAHTLLGYFFGRPVLDFVAGLDLSLGVVLSLLLLAVFLVWIVRARVVVRAGGAGAGPPAPGGRAPSRPRRLSSGALAGALATLVSTLFMNVLTHFTGTLAFQAPGTLVERTAQRLPLAVAREGGPWLLALAVPAFALVGVFWGAAYAGWAEPRLRLPDWLRGLLFAALPLATSLLVVMPALGLRFAEPDARLVAAAGEAVRHAAYGVVLGLIYPELLARPWAPFAAAPRAPRPGGPS